MTKLEFKYQYEIDIDGTYDKYGIKYIGKATHQFNSTWRCLADVFGSLCIVEVTLHF